MKISLFPTRHYLGILKDDSALSLSKLEKETLLDTQYVVNWSSNTFNGSIQENSFKVSLSNKYYGKLCFFKGSIENKQVHIKIQIKNIYKWIFIILFLYPLIGLVLSFSLRGYDASKGLIFHSLMAPITFRIALEIGFIFISKKGIKRLTEILEINMLKRAEAKKY